jgi:hypothetical protein
MRAASPADDGLGFRETGFPRAETDRVGGIPFTRGPLAYLLRNRFYVGEVVFKGETLAGEQPAIVDQNLFDAVIARHCSGCLRTILHVTRARCRKQSPIWTSTNGPMGDPNVARLTGVLWG